VVVAGVSGRGAHALDVDEWDGCQHRMQSEVHKKGFLKSASLVPTTGIRGADAVAMEVCTCKPTTVFI
jgi:hypothetical protein